MPLKIKVVRTLRCPDHHYDPDKKGAAFRAKCRYCRNLYSLFQLRVEFERQVRVHAANTEPLLAAKKLKKLASKTAAS
jgi:hypothetical protein